MQHKTLLTLMLSAVAMLSSAQTNGQKTFLHTRQMPDATKFLPGPPDTTSVAWLADFDMYRRSKALRPTERGRMAVFDCWWQTDSVLKGFAPALGLSITRKSMPVTYDFIDIVHKDIRKGVSKPKRHYGRRRPYSQMHELPMDTSQASYLDPMSSYPSGHSVRGWGLALVLTELFPDSADAILRRGYEYGQSRVIGGYHYQSDVEAARLVASAVVARLHADKAFLRAMEKAKREIARIKKDKR